MCKRWGWTLGKLLRTGPEAGPGEGQTGPSALASPPHCSQPRLRSWGPRFLAICVLMMWGWPEGSQCSGLLYNPIIDCNPCMKYLEICLPINSYLKDNHIPTHRPQGQVLPSHLKLLSQPWLGYFNCPHPVCDIFNLTILEKKIYIQREGPPLMSLSKHEGRILRS